MKEWSLTRIQCLCLRVVGVHCVLTVRFYKLVTVKKAKSKRVEDERAFLSLSLSFPFVLFLSI